MKIDEMPAGREMDELVAREVMGSDHLRPLPLFSYDIKAAWAVVEKLANMGYVVSVAWGPDRVGTNYASVQMMLSCHLAADLVCEMDGKAMTVSLAICRAALKAVRAESC